RGLPGRPSLALRHTGSCVLAHSLAIRRGRAAVLCSRCGNTAPGMLAHAEVDRLGRTCLAMGRGLVELSFAGGWVVGAGRPVAAFPARGSREARSRLRP